MDINLNDFQGIHGLVVAEVTSDTKKGIEYGPVTPLTGVASISSDVEESSESKYYDNKPAIVSTGEGADTYTLEVSVPDFTNRAILEGKTYDETKQCYVGTPTKRKYYALGFKAGLTDGTEEYYWLLKGKFAGGGKSFNTKTAGAESNGMSYTFTSIYTEAEFQLTASKESAKFSVIKSTHSGAGTFFDTVTTPDKVSVAP